jgi:hypothetical protein
MKGNTTIKNICRKDGTVMLVQSHTKITEKHLKQKYYFTEWYKCPQCKTIYLIESKKHLNN